MWNRLASNRNFLKLTLLSIRRPALVAVSIAMLASEAPPASAQSLLVTPNQIEIEKATQHFRSDQTIKAQRIELLRQFEAVPSAKLMDGRATLDQAIEETSNAALQIAYLMSTSENPKILWNVAPPFNVEDQQISGSRMVIDNPDNVYRMSVLDVGGRYIIKAIRYKDEPVQSSFFIYDPSQNGKTQNDDGKRGGDRPTAGLLDKDIIVRPDGTYEILIDSDPANGRPNHITLPTVNVESSAQISQAAPRMVLLIRNTINDWRTQRPDQLEIQRLDVSPQKAQMSGTVLAGIISKLHLKMAQGFLALQEKFAGAAPVNGSDVPTLRGGDWGYISVGKYKLSDDDGLMVTVNPLEARYVGAQVTDPWQISRSPITHQSSLNNKQALKNPDGTITYIISPRDVGAANWLDTVGLHDGYFAIRWQVVPDVIKQSDIKSAVKEVKLVKLSELPASILRVSTEKRKENILEREADYFVRVGKSTNISEP